MSLAEAADTGDMCGRTKSRGNGGRCSDTMTKIHPLESDEAGVASGM